MAKTVAILGAGASWDYGLPTGAELLAAIENLCRTASADTGLDRAAEVFRIAANATLGGSDSWHQIQVQSGRMAALLKGQMPQSIDWFLGQKFGPNFTLVKKLGLLAIAQMIGNAERTHESWQEEPRLRPAGGDGKGGSAWLKTMWQSLGVRDLEDFNRLIAEDSLRVVTFNYDRSFDQFVFNRLAALKEAQSGLQTDSPSPAELLRKLDICHVYGDLGDINDVKFGEIYRLHQRSELRNALGGQLTKSAARLRVIEEDRSDDLSDGPFAKARDWIASADRLVFLGFGFDPTNVERLGFPNLAKRSRHIFATSFGLGAVARDEVCRLLVKDWAQGDVTNIAHEHQTWDVDGYLRHFQPFKDLARPRI